VLDAANGNPGAGMAVTLYGETRGNTARS